MKARSMTEKTLYGIAAFSVLVFSLNCASNKTYTVRPPIAEERDAETVPKPKEKKINLYEDAIDKVFVEELDDFFNLPGHIRNLANTHKQARNVNALDEVPNSTWFTNRNGVKPMSLKAIQRGPNRRPGPDMHSPLTIVGAKLEGITPGLTVRDSRGDTYLVKFDVKGYPQLATAAEVITTKFVYAAGYNTPENYLSVFDPKALRIAEHARMRNRWGREVPMTRKYIDEILAKAEANPDGTYRVLASKFLDGRVIGPFQYKGRRKDDPNDHIRHHHRRELRGYKIIAAWLNIFDTKANNTLDMYVTENNRSFVRHYLIDFGTSLGSSGTGPARRSVGHEGGLDVGKMVAKILTFGLWVQPWEKQPKLIRPSVGYFESRLFDPSDYKFIVPNPAFQRATNRDLFWGAKIVMSFTDEQIRAVVRTGQYSDPQDEAYMIKTLIERRDKIGRFWYEKVNPLVDFRVIQDSRHQYGLAFRDLAVEADFAELSSTTYRYKIYQNDEILADYLVTKGQAFLPLDAILKGAKGSVAANGPSSGEHTLFNVRIETKRAKERSWSKSTRVFFSYSLSNGALPQIIAVERED